MKSNNTFGVHFVLRKSKTAQDEKFPVYARITVNRSRCEFVVKKEIHKNDWNFGKGAAKPKNDELRQFNSYLQELQGKLARHFRELQLDDQPVTAVLVRNAYIGIKKGKIVRTLLWLVSQHNTMMQKVLKKGSLKNYFTTEKYIKSFLTKHRKIADIDLEHLNYEFISDFEFFVRSNAIKKNDPCTNNGTMKHIERLKKMVTWAVKNEWVSKDPFINFRLKFKHKEREFLNELELASLESQDFDVPILQKVKDLFVFSCYTGLSYIDLVELKPQHIITGIDKVKWIKTCRAKTDTVVNVPILTPAEQILDKYAGSADFRKEDTVFPYISNQEMNRSLKTISEVCGIRKYLTFHLARHTFATTVTLMNGVPIETISKMLGHHKITTTMIYAKVTQAKVGTDMGLLQNKLDKNSIQKPKGLTAVI